MLKVAQRAAASGGSFEWRGKKLQARLVQNIKGGGRRGIAFEVAFADAVSDLHQSPLFSPSEVAETGLASLVAGPQSGAIVVAPSSAPLTMLPRSRVIADEDETREATWRFSIIAPIRRATEPGSPQRARAVADLAASPVTDWRGQRRELAERTIRRWLARYEADGLAGLMRKAPANGGEDRVILAREWDAVMSAAGLDKETIEAIATRIRRRVRSEWANGTPSWPTVRLNVTPLAVRLAREAGVDLPNEALIKVCMLPRNVIEEGRPHQAVAIAEKDAARFAARFHPRIKRDRSHLRPGEWVAGDVHTVDILFRCPDGRIVTPKAVAWLNLATNMAWLDIVIPGPGEAVRTEHVIQSFVSMCQDPRWGVPSRLYLDNGSEYRWAEEHAGDLGKLKHKIELRFDGLAGDLGIEPPAEARAGVHLAKPYNPQAKVIESLFSNLERSVFSQIPGWIGGNRMRKKTANQGREPEPFPGDEEALRKAIATAIAYYHVKPQEGHLAGASPNERFAQFVEAGFAATILDPLEAAVAFSVEHVKPVHTGGIIKLGKGQHYHSEALAPLADLQKVLVRQPRYGDRDRLFVFQLDRKFIDVAKLDQTYGFGDPAGAKEQRAREKDLRRRLRRLAHEAERDAGGLPAMADVVQLFGDTPEAAPPEAKISINPEFTAAGRHVRSAPTRAARDAERREAETARKTSLLARMAGAGG